MAGLDKPPFCLRQRRDGQDKTSGAGVRWRFDQARRKPPVRGRTGQAAFLPAAEAGRSQRNQRRGRALMVRTGAAKAAGPWPDWTSRLSACGRGGKVTAKPAARACAGGSIKRGESRRSRARIVPRGHAPRIVPRGHAPRIDSPGTGRKAVRAWRNWTFLA